MYDRGVSKHIPADDSFGTPPGVDPDQELQALPARWEGPPHQEFRRPVQSNIQALPFEELTWENFERLCVRLIRREPGVDHARLYGIAGQNQHGIDIFARENK